MWSNYDAGLLINGVMAELGEMLEEIECTCGSHGEGYPPLVQILHGESADDVVIIMQHEPHCTAISELRTY